MTLQPATVDALQADVLAHQAIRVRAGGTKSAPDAGATLCLRALTGIIDYSPDECVLTARAGTPLAEIEQALTANGQYLPFDPPLASHGATIGGTVAAGISGPLRYRYGGVRDFVIGARIIDGEGRSIRSGGKVVKNAAGFLLHHAMVGSQGRFGVLSEVTLKVFPQPEARATVTARHGGLTAAAGAARALESKRFDLEALDFDSNGTVSVRIAGRSEGLGARVARVIEAIGGGEVSSADEPRLWSDARDFAWAPASAALVRVPMSASANSAATALGPTTSEPSGLGPLTVRYSCGGRLAWFATDDVARVAAWLSSAGLRGVIVRGAHAGAAIGALAPNIFEDRVRRVLDPRDRFRAASDSR